MMPKMSEPRFKLYYWPLPFRSSFISYLFAYRDVVLLEERNFEIIQKLWNQRPGEQPIPFMGPPVLVDMKSDRSLSQMPAIVLYVSRELDLLPEHTFDLAMSMKILMDCNDLLMEICRYNGSSMWTHEEWIEFRTQRFPRWLDIFEESLKRGYLSDDSVRFAEISVFALFGPMTRCLPKLDAHLLDYAPGIHSLCQRIGSKASLANYFADESRKYGSLYCGGDIERSIRKMLAMDAE